MNEEEVRGKLLLPYLNDLGFDISEISLEKSFVIRLGKSKRVINGRSDILCRRNGKNLFIIELKNDSISIDQDDIEQGISYARLLDDNIAPFTIITNGKTTRIFDSISREELTGTKISKQSSFWQSDYTLSTDIDLRIRYEALKKFVSFSAENLKTFCEAQVRDRMGTIVGNIDNPYAKFVKELSIPRKDLQDAFDKFTDSEASVFGIVGFAGVGKTSTMCSLALQTLESEFVFFYNASIINKSPLELLAQDLNGVFSSKSENDIVLKKLDEIGKFLNKNVLIFIDAIDESTDSNLALELSEIALTVRALEKVKICISCKSNIWSSLLMKNDTPTHLFEELNKFHYKISSLKNCPGFLLEDFTAEETHKVIPIYKHVFGFKGQISESLFKALKNGFFLRIFSEVYSQREIPLEINDKELIKKYIQQSLEKMTNISSQFGLRILAKIGKILIDHKYSSREAHYDEGLEVESLIEKLDFSLEETIPEDLFTRNILIKSNKEDSYNISFYYSKIRDYIICFHSYKLDKLSDNEFYNSLETFYENYIGQSAISFYIENASANHKRMFSKFKKDKSLQYVISYNNYLDKHFFEFKDKFNPQTKGDIGIFLPYDLIKDDGYALFPLKPSSSNKVQYERFGNLFFNDDLFWKKGVNSVSSSNISLLTANQDKTIRQDIFKQLKEIIDKGKISVYNSNILLLEQVSTILYYYSKQLGYIYKLNDYYLPRFDLIYPIDLNDLKDRIYKFRVTEHYKWQNLEPKIRAEKVAEALKENLDIPILKTTGDFPPFEELFKIVEILLNNDYNEIVEHHLPCPDISINETKTFLSKNLDIPQIRTLQFSEVQANLYIESFLKHFESCYKEFVECCFPTLKDKFPFFATLPHEYFIYLRDFNGLVRGDLMGYRPSTSGETKINFKKFSSAEEAFKSGETNILRGFSLFQILHNDYLHKIKTIDKINTAKVDEFCVLRNWIYRFLKEDMKDLFKENKE